MLQIKLCVANSPLNSYVLSLLQNCWMFCQAKGNMKMTVIHLHLMNPQTMI